MKEVKTGYKHGFVTDIESQNIRRGLDEDIVRLISAKKDEPEWLLEYRLTAFRHWQTMTEPHWAKAEYKPIKYDELYYYSAPKSVETKPASLDELDPELLKTFERLGIPLTEQKRISGVAIDAVFDSVSLGTTHKDILEKHGVIFCSISEAVKTHPELVRKYLGTVVPHTDNFYAALNAAVFTDGSFCYIPKGVTCPLDLSTYFRINAQETGQFERTLLIADSGSFVNY